MFCLYDDFYKPRMFLKLVMNYWNCLLTFLMIQIFFIISDQSMHIMVSNFMNFSILTLIGRWMSLEEYCRIFNGVIIYIDSILKDFINIMN